jgi:hypothetical protein
MCTSQIRVLPLHTPLQNSQLPHPIASYSRKQLYCRSNLGENITLFRGGVRVKVRAVASYFNLRNCVPPLFCPLLGRLDEWRRAKTLTEAAYERDSPAIHRKANTMHTMSYPLIFGFYLDYILKKTRTNFGMEVFFSNFQK